MLVQTSFCNTLKLFSPHHHRPVVLCKSAATFVVVCICMTRPTVCEAFSIAGCGGLLCLLFAFQFLHQACLVDSPSCTLHIVSLALILTGDVALIVLLLKHSSTSCTSSQRLAHGDFCSTLYLAEKTTCTSMLAYKGHISSLSWSMNKCKT